MTATGTFPREVVIVGSGPAGYSAAIYAARAGLRPVLVASSVEAGGELMKTTDVENYPGFPSGIQGPELMTQLQEQAERFGAEILYDDVVSLELSRPVKTVETSSSGRIEAHSVIYATGSAYRQLGLADEKRLSGRGVSWCATCDGFFFKNKTIAVIGGGDSAMEEATFLTRFASKVYVVHRRDSLKASKIMQERAFADPRIEFVWNAEVTAIEGTDAVEGLVLSIGPDGATRRIDVQGVFVAIGNDPRTDLLDGQLRLTRWGTVDVEGRTSKTDVPGVFAAGDVIDPFYRQAITAAASGTVAALDVEHYLAARSHAEELLAPPHSSILSDSAEATDSDRQDQQ